MGNYKKLGKNVGLIAIGTFSSKLLTFFLVPLYTTALSTEEYGTADVIFVTINLLLPVFTAVIFEAMLRFALDHNYDNRAVLAAGTLINGVGILLFLLCSPIILLFPDIKQYYVLFVFCFIARVIYENLIYFLRGIDQVKMCALGGICSTALMITLNIVFLLWFRWGVTGYMLATGLSSAITSMMLIFLSRIYKMMQGIKQVDPRTVKEMLRYSLPMVPNSISWWITNSSNKYILSFFHGAGMTGLFSVAHKIPSLVSTVSSMFEKAWQISSVEDFGSESSKKFYQDICSKYAAVQMICTSGVILFSDLFARILFQKAFYEARAFVPILVVGAMFHSLSAFFGTIYTAAKQTRFLFVSTLVAGVANIAMSFLLIPQWGAYGASVATLISYFAVCMFRMIHSRKIMAVKIEYVRNFSCYVLLALQIWIHYNAFDNVYIYSFLVFAAIVLLCHRFIRDMVKLGMTLVKKLLKRGKC